MAALFPRWSNTAFRLGLVALAAGGAALPVGAMILVRTPYITSQFSPPDQPVQFDHRHHIRDDNVDCRYCHQTVERSSQASIPATEICMNCHNQLWNDSPMIEPLRRSYFSGKPMPWNKVHDLPDFVYFNHSAHLSNGVGCVECHGRVDKMASIYQDKPLSMGWCLSCHREPETHLRPQEALTSMTWKLEDAAKAAGKDAATYSAELANQYKVRKLTNCTTCHR